MTNTTPHAGFLHRAFLPAAESATRNCLPHFGQAVIMVILRCKEVCEWSRGTTSQRPTHRDSPHRSHSRPKVHIPLVTGTCQTSRVRVGAHYRSKRASCKRPRRVLQDSTTRAFRGVHRTRCRPRPTGGVAPHRTSSSCAAGESSRHPLRRGGIWGFSRPPLGTIHQLGDSPAPPSCHRRVPSRCAGTAVRKVAVLQAAEERHQVLLFLLAKPGSEHQVVELHGIFQSQQPAVVVVGR